MKTCPKCRKSYPDEYNICPQDGDALLPMVVDVAGEPFNHLIDDKYQVLRLVGRGGMGAVYEAVHTTMQRRVAIKILNPDLVSNPAAMERFRREALASGRLKHPNAITIYDYGTTNRGEAFIVMEFLEGCSLNQEIQVAAPMPPERVAWILAQAADAVHAAHQEGIVHRDLKPANIMLEKLRTGEVVKVLDFGIAKLAAGGSSSVMNLTGTGIIGTPQYMSPEQCQALNVDARTDVYSLGIIAYEMLTGVLPFDGPAPLAIVIAHVKQPTPSLRERRTDLPEAFEAVVMKALSKDPARRQQSAEDLAGDFRRLLRDLSPNYVGAVDARRTGATPRIGTPLVPDDSRPPRPMPSESPERRPPSPEGLLHPRNIPPRPAREPVSLPTYASTERFVGRTPEIGALRNAWQRANNRRGGRPILLCGEPGIGKTRLAEELHERLDDLSDEPAPFFLTNRFFEYGGAAPYQVIVEALRPALLALFGKESPEAIALDPDEERQVSRQFLASILVDEYLDVFSASGRSTADQEKYPIFDRLSRLVQLLARRRGVVLFLDDLQWADDLTLECLAFLNRHLAAERILLVTAMRANVLTLENHPLRRWMRQLDECGGFEQITLQPLSDSEVRAMVEGMFNNAIQLSAGLIQLLTEETKGNPYHVGEIIRQMISGGQIRRDATSKWFCPEVNEFDLPESISAIVASQVGRLNEDAADVLAQAAVIGEEFTFDLLQPVTELPEEALLDAVEAGLKAGILREVVSAGEDRYVFAQSTIHRVLYKRISRRRRKRLHGRVAERLERTAASASASSAGFVRDRMAGDLAYHYFRAEDWNQAIRYAMEAGYIKWRTYGVGEAGKYYGWVAQCLQFAQKPGETGDIELPRPDILAQFHLNYGILLSECAQLEEAEKQLQRALALCREHVPSLLGRTQTALGRLCNLAGFSDQALEYASSGLELLQEIDDRMGAIISLQTIGEAHLSRGRHDYATQFLEKALETANQVGDRAGKASVLSSIGYMYYQQGRYSQALTAANQGLAIARSLGNVFEERRTLNLLGNIHLFLGQIEEAQSCYEAALHMACALGHRPGEAAALSHIGETLARRERYGEALENFQRAVRIARDIGNRLAEGRYLLNIGKAQRERREYKAALAALEQALEISREVETLHIECEILQALGDTYRRMNRFDEAKAALLESAALARRSNFPQVAWRTLYLLALCDYAQGNIVDTREHLSESIAIIETLRAEIDKDDDFTESFMRDKQVVYDFLASLKQAVKGTNEGDIPLRQASLNDLVSSLLSPESAPLPSEIVDLAPAVIPTSDEPPAPTVASTDELSDLMEFAAEIGIDEILAIGPREGEPPSGPIEEPPGRATPRSNPRTPPHLASSVISLESNWNEMLAAARATNDRESERKALTLIASSLHSHGDLAGARDHYQRALQLGKELGARHGEGALLNNIGETFRQEGRYADALAYYRLALRSAREFKDVCAEEVALVNAGAMFMKVGQISEAVDLLSQVEAVNHVTQDRVLRAGALQSLGEVYWIQKKHSKALEACQEAFTLALETNDADIEWRSQWVIGRCRWVRQEKSVALSTLRDCLASLDRYLAEVRADVMRRRLLADRNEISQLIDDWQREAGR